MPVPAWERHSGVPVPAGTGTLQFAMNGRPRRDRHPRVTGDGFGFGGLRGGDVMAVDETKHSL